MEILCLLLLLQARLYHIFKIATIDIAIHRDVMEVYIHCLIQRPINPEVISYVAYEAT
jgi:hypothetical protein